MSHKITFDPAQKRITVVVTPPVKQNEVLDCLRKIRSDPDFPANYGIVVNLLETGPNGYPSVSDVAGFDKTLKTLFPGQKVAVLSLHPRTMRSGFIAVTASPEAVFQTRGELGDDDMLES